MHLPVEIQEELFMHQKKQGRHVGVPKATQHEWIAIKYKIMIQLPYISIRSRSTICKKLDTGRNNSSSMHWWKDKYFLSFHWYCHLNCIHSPNDMEISNPINKDSAITPFWFVSITSKTPYSTHQFLDSKWNGRHPAILNLVWKEQKKKKIAYTILLAYNPNHNLKLQWERWGLEEKFTHGNLQGGVFLASTSISQMCVHLRIFLSCCRLERTLICCCSLTRHSYLWATSTTLGCTLLLFLLQNVPLHNCRPFFQ